MTGSTVLVDGDLLTRLVPRMETWIRGRDLRIELVITPLEMNTQNEKQRGENEEVENEKEGEKERQRGGDGDESVEGGETDDEDDGDEGEGWMDCQGEDEGEGKGEMEGKRREKTEGTPEKEREENVVMKHDETLCYEISGKGKDWIPRYYVAMLTEMFQKGVTRCVVGTRGMPLSLCLSLDVALSVFLFLCGSFSLFF